MYYFHYHKVISYIYHFKASCLSIYTAQFQMITSFVFLWVASFLLVKKGQIHAHHQYLMARLQNTFSSFDVL